MSISAVTAPAPAPIQAPGTSEPKNPDKTPGKTPDVNAGAADGTRLPRPTLLAALPPGQGTRVDQLV
jgi:hypothetical protein